VKVGKYKFVLTKIPQGGIKKHFWENFPEVGEGFEVLGMRVGGS